MDTELLKTFLEVRNTRHFGHAADNLHITQAAVSARIRQLEELLGHQLFVRRRNNIRLSAEGERLVPHAETVLLAWWRARQSVALEGAASRQVYLGLRAGILTESLHKRFRRLARSQPELALRVDGKRPETAVRMLLDGTLDAAMLSDVPNLPELQSITVGELSLRLFSSARATGLEDALGEDYVYVDWGADFDRFHAREVGETAPVLRTNLRALALDYLSEHAASGYFPNSLKSVLAERGIREVRKAPRFERPLGLVFNSASAQLAQIESLAGILQGVRL